MSRLAEKLELLHEYGEALLTRVFHARRIVTYHKLSFLSDAQGSKVLGAALRKFPDATNAEKTPGFDALLNISKEVADDLESVYFAIVDSAEFTVSAANVIKEATDTLKHFQLDKNPITSVKYLDVATQLVRIHLLLASIPEKKSVVLFFNKWHGKYKGLEEPAYPQAAQFALDLDIPFKVLHSVVNESSQAQIVAILSAIADQYMILQNTDEHRNQGTFNLTAKPNAMCHPSVTIEQFWPRLYPKFGAWFSYLFLITPEQFVTPVPINLLRTSLAHSHVQPCFFNFSVPLHQEYENFFANYKGKSAKQLKKDRKVFGEILQLVPANGPKNHANKRLFLLQELQNVSRLFNDFPGLIGPKIENVWALLTMAKDEILQYFAMRANPAPKSVQKLFIDKLTRDPRIIELIDVIDKVSGLIYQYKYILQEYYLEYLKGCDLEKYYEILSNFANKNPTSPVLPALNNILGELQNISIDNFRAGITPSFDALRLNCARAEAYLTSDQAPSFDLLVTFTHRLFLIHQHSKNVDLVDTVVTEATSLVELYYYQDIVLDDLQANLQSNQVGGLPGLFRLISYFPYVVTQYNANESSVVRKECASIVSKIVSILADLTAKTVLDIANEYLLFDRQTEPLNAAHPFYLQKNFRWPQAPVVGVGSESRSFDAISQLVQLEDNLPKLLSVFRDLEPLTVVDSTVSIVAHLRDAIIEQAKKQILTNIAWNDREAGRLMIKPSTLERRIDTISHALRKIEDYVFIDVDQIIQKIVLDLVYHPIFDKDTEDPVDWINVKELDLKDSAPLMGPIVDWFHKFVTVRIDEIGAIYSPLRKSYALRPLPPASLQNPVAIIASQSTFHPETICNLTELTALSRVIGSYGIRLIDFPLLRHVQKTMGQIVMHISVNLAELQKVETNLPKGDSLTFEAIRAIRDLDGFMHNCLSVGNVLLFRKLMYEALGTASRDTIPLIHQTVRNVQDLHTTNIFVDPLLTKLDALAVESGVHDQYADPALKDLLISVAQGNNLTLWSAVPYALASGFVSNVWTQAVYRPSMEAYTNNAHGLCDTFNLLLVTLPALAGCSLADIRELCETFVRISSVILQRIQRQPVREVQKLFRFANFSSVILFMDLFIQSCPFLSRTSLETFMPYANIRAIYRDLCTLEGI